MGGSFSFGENPAFSERPASTLAQLLPPCATLKCLKLLTVALLQNDCKEKLNEEVNYLNSTENGEAHKASHGATDVHDNTGEGHLDVLLNLVISCRLKVDLDELQITFPCLF